MIENKDTHKATDITKVKTSKLNTKRKTKKHNTVMIVPIKYYPENINILKKPVGKTHKCSYVFKGKKLKKYKKKTK